MTEKMLLEQCVICGRVVRDDRIDFRLPHPHLHWAPRPNEDDNGEATLTWNPGSGDPVALTLHATVCVEHLETPINWEKFAAARQYTKDNWPQFLPERYGKPSQNAALTGYIGHGKPAARIRNKLNAAYLRYVAVHRTGMPFFGVDES